MEKEMLVKIVMMVIHKMVMVVLIFVDKNKVGLVLVEHRFNKVYVLIKLKNQFLKKKELSFMGEKLYKV